MIDQRLKDYFKFDEADLQANRIGQITDKQKARLVKENTSSQVGRVIGGIFLLLIGLVGLALAAGTIWAAGFPSFAQDGLGVWVLFILWEIGWLIFALGFFIWGSRVLKRGFQGFSVTLQRVMGPINIIKVERTSTHTDSDGFSHTSHYFVYELHIDGQSFDVESNLADITMQGDTYAVYYTEGSENDILSAELISNAR